MLRTWLAMDLNWEEGGSVVDQCMYVARAYGQLGRPSWSWEWLEEVPIEGKTKPGLGPLSLRLGVSQRDVSGRQPASWVWSSRKRPGLQAETWGLVGI